MEHSICLNCDEPVVKKFCASCGQKTDTHRIDLKHFFLHDVLHGVWHMDKGILFTLKQVIVRPGKAALDYISGKRIRFYNVFYLSLLLIGLCLLLSHFRNSLIIEKPQEEVEYLSLFQRRYLKFILFGFVPVVAFNAKLAFWKEKLNFAEHVIIAGMTLLGILLLSNFVVLADTIITLGFLQKVFMVIKGILYLAVAYYPFWVYRNAFGKNYKWYSFSLRMIWFYLLFIIEYIGFLAATMVIMGENSLYIGFNF